MLEGADHSDNGIVGASHPAGAFLPGAADAGTAAGCCCVAAGRLFEVRGARFTNAACGAADRLAIPPQRAPDGSQRFGLGKPCGLPAHAGKATGNGENRTVAEVDQGLRHQTYPFTPSGPGRA